MDCYQSRFDTLLEVVRNFHQLEIYENSKVNLLNLKLINDTKQNVYDNIKENKKYVIVIPNLSIKLEAEIYYIAISSVEFKINKINGKKSNIYLNYKFDNFDSIEYLKYEKCYIFLVNN